MKKIQTIFPNIQVKIFLSTFVAMFIMVTLQYLGIKPPQFLQSPIPNKDDVFFHFVQPKLKEIPVGNFSLKRQNSLIAKAHASGTYDNASAYVVLDFTTGEVLLEKKSKTPLAVASLTKIMTSVVALDLAEQNEVFTVTKRAARVIPTKIGINPGEKLALSDLLEALLLTSANDAAQTIKDGIDDKYNDAVFIKAMNTKARLLNLHDTHFDNPQGFDGENYSTAEDLAVLTYYAMQNYPLFSEIVKKESASIPEDAYHNQFDLKNWNGLVGVYPRVSGVKIGNTMQAGKTTVVLSEREDKPMLAVVLGAPGIIERDMWAAELLDTAYAEKFGLHPVKISEAQLRAKYATWYK